MCWTTRLRILVTNIAVLQLVCIYTSCLVSLAPYAGYCQVAEIGGEGRQLGPSDTTISDFVQNLSFTTGALILSRLCMSEGSIWVCGRV